MPVCVVVLSDNAAADGLTQQLRDTDVPLLQCLAIPPTGDAIDQVELLSPILTRARRQKALRLPGRRDLHQDHQPHHLRQLRNLG